MQSGAQYRLIVRRGPQPNQQFELNRDKLTIGRDVTNDVIISDPEISRHHARLIRTANGYAIEDLRSTNGTFVNRQRISSLQQLYDGDVLGLGETVTLTYQIVGAPHDATVSSGYRETPAYREPVAPPPPAYAPPRQQPAYEPAPRYRDREYEDYEYEYEDEVEPDRNRMLVISCAALTLLFCCVLVGGAIYIDAANLYCDVPILRGMEFFCLPQ